ncbi:MAG: hypothetical protein J4215_02640 [Candidatus Diapherotrites archaeon]|uniref:Uncharacterized protein n=1 Tax=Candidatus Iainarchaeum sp. TaxID=3101447 RepID=A0A8T4L2A5_9ARCH|nr:hypothetical protein [Candidatus Diapherotrites archaeon]
MVSSVWLDSLFGNLEIALILFFFVWLFSWAKGSLGSEKLAVFFAILIIYLTVFQYRELIWIAVALFLLSTFGKELFSKLSK